MATNQHASPGPRRPPAGRYACPDCDGVLALTHGSWGCLDCSYVPRHGAD